jgi:hypothetical protein
MEGLLGTPIPQVETVQEVFVERERDERLVHRWLAVLFLAMLGLLAIAYLAAALNPM